MSVHRSILPSNPVGSRDRRPTGDLDQRASCRCVDATNLTAFAVPWPEWGNLFADFYFVPATDCASASLHWSLTLPILFRMQLLSLPGQLSFTSVVQALLISATRASLALHASENSAACVFTQSLMRPPPGLTSAHFALMSAAQTPTDRAIATGAERSTTAPITMILFIIGHSPKRKKDANVLTHLAGHKLGFPDRYLAISRDTALSKSLWFAKASADGNNKLA